MTEFVLVATVGEIELESYNGRTVRCTKVQLMNDLGREATEANNAAELKSRVEDFGNRVKKAHPDASFIVSTIVRNGSRKFRGYDKLDKANAFGIHNWMKVIDKRQPAPVAEAPGA